jgi:hypothetical protein
MGAPSPYPALAPPIVRYLPVRSRPNARLPSSRVVTLSCCCTTAAIDLFAYHDCAEKHEEMRFAPYKRRHRSSQSRDCQALVNCTLGFWGLHFPNFDRLPQSQQSRVADMACHTNSKLFSKKKQNCLAITSIE